MEKRSQQRRKRVVRSRESDIEKRDLQRAEGNLQENKNRESDVGEIDKQRNENDRWRRIYGKDCTERNLQKSTKKELSRLFAGTSVNSRYFLAVRSEKRDLRHLLDPTASCSGWMSLSQVTFPCSVVLGRGRGWSLSSLRLGSSVFDPTELNTNQLKISSDQDLAQNWHAKEGSRRVEQQWEEEADEMSTEKEKRGAVSEERKESGVKSVLSTEKREVRNAVSEEREERSVRNVLSTEKEKREVKNAEKVEVRQIYHQTRERSPCFNEHGRRRRGYQFGGLNLIETDPELDPPVGRCFVCLGIGHAHNVCPNRNQHLDLIYCFNCGRRNRTLWSCERCKDAHHMYRAKRGLNDKRLEPPRRFIVQANERERSYSTPPQDNLLSNQTATLTWGKDKSPRAASCQVATTTSHPTNAVSLFKTVQLTTVRALKSVGGSSGVDGASKLVNYGEYKRCNNELSHKNKLICSRCQRILDYSQRKQKSALPAPTQRWTQGQVKLTQTETSVRKQSVVLQFRHLRELQTNYLQHQRYGEGCSPRSRCSCQSFSED